MWRYSSMMAFDFFSIASSVKAGSLGTEGAAGVLSLAVRGKEKKHKLLWLFLQLELEGKKKEAKNEMTNKFHPFQNTMTVYFYSKSLKLIGCDEP